MAQNMNTQLKALCQEIYEQDGLAAVRDLAKQIAPWCKERVDLEKRGAAEAKLQAADAKKLDLLGKAQEQPRKAVIRELRKNETFKQLKTQIADAEKAAHKAAADAKKLAAAEAKANKPTKVDAVWIKCWNKVLTKMIKCGETETKKALSQLKQLKTKKVQADAKAVKEAAAKVKKDAAKVKKDAAETKKLAAANAKVNKPSKSDVAMIKRWNKVLTKGIKRGETETKKALTQLKQLRTKKVAANAKAAKVAAKEAKEAKPKAKKTKKKALEEAAVGDDLIATLLAKANETVAAPPVELVPEPVEEEAEAEPEEDVAVVRFEHAGVKYLKDTEGYLYDPVHLAEVGFWNGSEVEELDEM